MNKAGYRGGIEQGAEEVLQSNFDDGYEVGFATGLMLGRYKALATHLFSTHQFPMAIKLLLTAMKEGKCHLCAIEQGDNFDKLDTSYLVEDHKMHVDALIEELYNYFAPLLTERQMENLKIN
uniref:Essential protein Yae1 N-terminal domain-containing protein n=1 Tax=Bracon brevicornis TaxID=1563983 RepID=A0A6V7HNC2_9HYME